MKNKADKKLVRIDKYLANSGVISRRGVSEFLKKGEVVVNGKRILEVGERIDPAMDEIVIDGKRLKRSLDMVYLILNKPLGVVSTTSDDLGRKTVLDLVDTKVRVYPVGRLDSDSVGLILLTSDGVLTHKLTHPKFHIPKRYEVVVKGQVSEKQLEILRSGVMLKEGMTSNAEVEIIKEYPITTKLKFIIHEGRNRQIRRMCASVELEVLELKRVGIGPINLGELKEGDFRELSDDEVRLLKSAVNLE